MALATDNGGNEGQVTERETLLRSVAEALKTPLMYIARQAELSRTQEAVSLDSLRQMQTNADAALRLVDSYLLGLDLAQQNLPLELEPVSLSSVLYDVAHDIEPLVRARGAHVELTIAGKYGQVMAHRLALEAALACLSSEFAAMLDTIEQDKVLPRLTLAAHRSPKGIIAGLYAAGTSRPVALGAAAALRGVAAQPFALSAHSTGAGIFVAGELFAAMGTTLRDGRFRGQHGLAVSLQQSTQMRLL